MLGIYFIIAFLSAGLIFITRQKFLTYLLVGVFLFVQSILTIYEYYHSDSITLIYFTPDALSLIFLCVLSCVSIASFYHSYIYLEKNSEITQPRERSFYFSAFIILIMALTGAYLANNIAVTWIFVEFTTLSASVLIYHERKKQSLEAAWKYLFICSISISMVFIGILFLSIGLQQFHINDLSYDSLFRNASLVNPFWLKLVLLFIFTGFTAKMGLFPFHTVCIDAHSVAPYPISAFISTVLMNAGFVGLFRTYKFIGCTSIHGWANVVMMVSAVVSILIAAIYIMSVKDVKRMLAYSSTENMGIMLLGFTAGGWGYYAAILHLVLHSFVKSSMFYQIGQVYRVYKSKSIFDIGNYFKVNTIGALVLLLCFISVMAIPPSGMFISEILIFRSMLEANHIWLLLAVLFLLSLILWALGKNIFKILFTKELNLDITRLPHISPGQTISQFLFLAFAIYLGLNPPVGFVHLIQESVKNLPH